MKRCPECRRDYTDETLNFCLDDGSPLVEGPASRDNAATAILSVHETEPATLSLPQESVDKPAAKTPSKKYLLIALAAVVVSVAGVAVYLYAKGEKPATEHFKNIKLDRITTEGAVESVAISPDGKYIAYSLEESGKRSMWTKHLGTESRVQIVPAVESISMFASAFSPDGGYVYYTRQDDQNPKGALYAVPVLGGTSRKIVSDVSQPVALSRDGKQIVFGRYKLKDSDDHLMIVNSDGSNERTLATVKEPDYLQGAAASWSPDGKMIAVGYGSEIPSDSGRSNVYKMSVAVVSVEGSDFKLISNERWGTVGRVAWLPDQSGLIFVAGEKRTGSKQIWKCHYPSGEVSRVTNDLNSYDYDSLSMTSDGSAMVAVQKHPSSQIWVVPDGDTNRSRPIATRKNVQDGRQGIGWTPSGQIVYDSGAGSNSSIWMMNSDGSGAAQQLTDGNTDDFAPEVSPDGQSVIFGSTRNGFQVWRIDIDGGNPKQMTYSTGTPTFSYSPDGRWIVSNPYVGGIFKIPADGGDAIPVVPKGPLVYPQVSPDGELVAYLSTDENTKRPKIFIVKFETGEFVSSFDLPVSTATSFSESLSFRGFHWSPDGKSIDYVDTIGGVSNLWRRSLNGGAAQQITDFKTDRIYTFAFSRDGKTLALSRGSDTPDAVLITDLK